MRFTILLSILLVVRSFNCEIGCEFSEDSSTFLALVLAGLFFMDFVEFARGIFRKGGDK